MNDHSNEAPNPVHVQRLEEARAEFLASCRDFDLQKYQENEIDRLQSLVQEHEEYIANLELEAASTDNKIDGLALLLGIMPDTGNRRIIGIIKDDILRLQAKVDYLNREANALAAANILQNGEKVDADSLQCWRRAAREAVEENS